MIRPPVTEPGETSFMPGATSVARRPRLGCLSARLLQDLHAGARTDPGRAGSNHRLERIEIAHAAGGLDAHLSADDPPHERDVSRGRTAGSEAGRGLHVI